MVNRFAIAQGWAWHVYPINTALDNPPLTFKHWTRAGLIEDSELINYGTNGILLLTQNATAPTVPNGWAAVTVTLGDDWTYHQGGWKWRALNNYGGGLHVFAGVMI